MAPNGGVTDSLDEAKAAFRAAWERPLSDGRSDEKCSVRAFFQSMARIGFSPGRFGLRAP
jgi:hypothetical protein